MERGLPVGSHVCNTIFLIPSCSSSSSHALKSQSCQDIFNTDAFIFRANNEQSKELSVHPAVKEVIGDLTKIRGKFEQCMRDVATPVFEERWAQWKEMV